ncbi:hypothetical protein [Brevundimonas subvibrioides]|uniref:Uncharacterized protein n=1 Tax=Brevundimonas subvibrioides (strain ATCC 15264 / DSM 4735 / LMG 14903 / NBRC 16000 / CB 81) TaxID=633149 RepID=D9QF58_BRESC|nr:hypothetical protein [Brevundimonas subvibrioides]ADL00543.1 hypothetical protein Bresu_1231 [Brevundimonas subvibrioides ATCC 15264]
MMFGSENDFEGEPHETNRDRGGLPVIAIAALPTLIGVVVLILQR